LRVVVITDIPSPYQVELLDAVGNHRGWTLTVIYVRRFDLQRAWNSTPILHDHFYLGEKVASEVRHRVANCDLVVFCGYRPAEVGRLIAFRAHSGKAWAFWGERPGFRLRGWLGYLYRGWALREVRHSQAPVWGIGDWAIDGYRSELGEGRLFFNVPYSSNLAPFFAIERQFEAGSACRFLFSGSFTRRKGIDLVASAFRQLSSEGYNVELHLLGAGPLEEAIKAQLSSVAARVFVHGFKQRHELASVYASADVLCAPSRYDGWGLVVVEGLAAGMPVISTNNTGAARELIEPRNGWVIPSGNRGSLLLAMRDATTLEVDRRRAMSQYGRQIAMKQDIEPGVKRFVHAAEKTIEAWPNDIGKTSKARL
jgi:glycosyltransferase involved in cell wall biosynthesis